MIIYDDFRNSKKIYKLNCNEIHYCIMFSPYIDIHTSSEKITVRKKISELEQKYQVNILLDVIGLI